MRRRTPFPTTLIASATVVVTVISALAGSPAATASTASGPHASAVTPPPVQVEPTPQGHHAVLSHHRFAIDRLAAGSGPRPGHTWPAAASSDLTLDVPARATSSARASAADLPLTVSASTSTEATRVRSTHLRTQVYGQSLATQLGITGAVFSVQRTAPSTAALDVDIDYASFRNASGGDYGQRLRLVQLPACALVTPAKPACDVQTPIAFHNDTSTYRLTTTVHSAATAGATAVVAAAAGPSGPNGSYTATSLAPSGSWSGGGSTGSFDYRYPIALPPSAGGDDVTPGVSLNYDSASVDGRVASTNTQPSTFGEGWDYSPGDIERTYQPCSDDTKLAKADQTGDECWDGQILTYSLNGSSNEIVRDDKTGGYRLKDDDGSRIDLVGAGTGAYQKEYWRVTSTGGVQYFFGRDTLPGGAVTNATWTEPVCGDSNTACTGNGHGVISPIETQAWRWNLDYVLDPHNNATAYYYTPETNSYGEDGKTTPVSYDRGGYLDRIDYGMRATSTSLSSASDQVVFTAAERCTSGCTTFNTANAAHWPDTPQSLACSSVSPCSQHSPSFWSRMRIDRIYTKYNDAGAMRIVDTYELGQRFPVNGDPELELDTITRVGSSWSGSTRSVLALPPVSFAYTLLDNRVAGYNAQPAMQMWRLNDIQTETGEQIHASYDQAGQSAAQCRSSSVPTDPAKNTAECFPVYWTPTGYTAPHIDWFHKHMLTEVDVDDENGTGTNRYTKYTYLGTPAWHFDDDEITRAKYRTYGQFRGYARVQTRTGNPNFASNGVADAWTLSTATYFRGMAGPDVTAPHAADIADDDQYAGQVRETQTFNGDTTSEISAVVDTPETTATTATRVRPGLSDLVARMVAPRSSTTYTDLAGGGTRTHSVSYSYDSIGREIHRMDSGTGVAPACTSTKYGDNTTNWIRDRVVEVIQSAQVCPAGSAAPSDILSDVRTYHGSSTLGTVSASGDATQVATETSSGHWTHAYTSYDALGRVTSTTQYPGDGTSRTTSIAYTPSTSGPVSSVVTTNALGQHTTTTFDPGRGEALSSTDVAGHRTDATFDQLGRVTAVWKPGQVKGTDPASVTYSYLEGPTAPLAVTTRTYVDPGTVDSRVHPGYQTSISLFDAFGQLRQTQSSAVGGGSNMTDTFTDGHGWVVATNNHYHEYVSPSTKLWNLDTAGSDGVESSTRTVFDGAGRPLKVTDYSDDRATRSTQTVYSGDSTTTIPPVGTAESTTRTDARGDTVELDRYLSAPTITGNTVSGGTFRSTTYGYDQLGRQTSITTPANDPAHASTWRTFYDLGGRVIRKDDPDTGISLSSYDDLDELTGTQDADDMPLAYSYDKLGRKTGEFAGKDVTAPRIASWSYDTVQAGQLSSSTSYTPTGDYTEKVTGYDDAGNPTGNELDLSKPDTGFASSYSSTETWTSTHLPASLTPTHEGGLADEEIQYQYDASGDLTGMGGQSSIISDAIYSPYGEPEQYTLGVNDQASWLGFGYDPETRRSTGVGLSVPEATPQVEDIGYTYDQSGNVTRSVDTEGAPGTATETQCYSYDALGELSQAWSATDSCAANPSTAGSGATVGGPQPYWESWSFDSAGGRTSQVQHALSGSLTGSTTTTYTNGVTSHAHAVASTRTTGASSSASSYSYDADGNVTSRTVAGRTQRFSYTRDGRTAAIMSTTPGATPKTTTFSYDADGNLLFQRDPGYTTLYLGGQQITRNTATGVQNGTRYYTANGVVVAMRIGYAPPVYLISDLHGTAATSVQSDQSGTETPVRRHFDPYGNPLANTDGSTTLGGKWLDNHAFLGKPTSASTGLDDLGARQYDPTIGRFLTVDPVLETDDPTALNGYNYADNDPINGSDPTGLCLTSGDTGNNCSYYPSANGGSNTSAPTPAQQKADDSGSPGGGSDTSAPSGAYNPDSNYDPDPTIPYTHHSCSIRCGLGHLTSDGIHVVSSGLHEAKALTFGAAEAQWDALKSCVTQGSVSGCIQTAVNAGILVCAVATGGLCEAAEGVEAGSELAEEALTATNAARAADTAVDSGTSLVDDTATSCANSFTADTPVTLADGSQEPIKDVKVGQKVLATDPITGKTRAEPVEQLIRHTGKHQMVLVTLADGSVLDATDGHPIWDATTSQFTDAANLHAGDNIETSGGTMLAISKLTTYSADLTAYNLQISTIHTYYAGSTPVLVHNSCDPSITFGHGARHLAGTGLSNTEVESAIQSQVQRSVANASSTGSFYGRVAVRGTQIEYRAYTLPDGTINVGTYYVP